MAKDKYLKLLCTNKTSYYSIKQKNALTTLSQIELFITNDNKDNKWCNNNKVLIDFNCWNDILEKDIFLAGY